MKQLLKAIASLHLLALLTACCTMTSNPTDMPILLSHDATDSLEFELGQTWETTPSTAHTSGTAQLRWEGQELVITAQLEDADVFTRTDGDNQHNWELGDVFEFFLQIEGHEDYFELHVTPNNHRFLAHKPNVPGNDPDSGEWKPIDHWIVSPISFSASARPAPNGWEASMNVPPSLLGLDRFEPGQLFRLSFARYDAGPNRDPVITSTAPHKTPSFHQPTDWHLIQLVQ